MAKDPYLAPRLKILIDKKVLNIQRMWYKLSFSNKFIVEFLIFIKILKTYFK